jgi:hypothetical protein
MIGYSDDAKVMDLLAPLRRIEPVPFAVPELSQRRPLLRRPVLVAVVLVVALALTGVAIANGVGAFNGISAAQNKPTGVKVLDRQALAAIKLQNSFASEHSTPRFPIPRLLPATARVLGRMPDGSKVFGLTDTRSDLCLIGEIGGVCGPPLSKSHPITFATFNPSPTTGGKFTASGVAIDGVTSVSFKVWSEDVMVPVRNNVWVYEKRHTTAHGARCIVVHFADGSTVDYPPTQCS